MKHLVQVIFFMWIFGLGSYPKLANAQKPQASYLPGDTISRDISDLQIPIQIPLQAMAKQMNQQLKGLIYEYEDDGKATGAQYTLKIYKLDAISVRDFEGGLLSDVPLKVRIKGNFPLQAMGVSVNASVDEELQLKVKLLSRIIIKKDWSVHTKTKLADYEWLKTPYIKVAFIKVPMTTLLDKVIEAQSPAISEQVDAEITRHLHIKPILESIWKEFQTPWPLASWGEDKTWLQFAPQALYISPLKIQKDTLSATMHIRAFCEAALAKGVKSGKISPLPELNRQDSIGDAVSLNIRGQVSRQLAREKAREIFVGQTYSFRKDKYKAELQDLHIYGSAGKTVIEMDLTGSVKGKMYLIGIPKYNPGKQRLEITDFSYVLDGETKISKFVRWLFAKKIKKELRGAAEDILNQQIQDLREDISKSLNAYELNEYSTLYGSTQDFYFEDIKLQDSKIFARIRYRGRLSLLLKDYGFEED